MGLPARLLSSSYPGSYEEPLTYTPASPINYVAHQDGLRWNPDFGVSFVPYLGWVDVCSYLLSKVSHRLTEKRQRVNKTSFFVLILLVIQ